MQICEVCIHRALVPLKAEFASLIRGTENAENKIFPLPLTPLDAGQGRR